MTDYREIIRLHSLKFSNVAIANYICNVDYKTVRNVWTGIEHGEDKDCIL